jgi:Family of unknown function (DUF6510)
MIDEMRSSDGNALAGPLGRFFAFDVTRMIVSCGNCGSESPLGALRLYGDQMGVVLRCVHCGEVNLRALEFNGSLSLDARGATRIVLRPSVDLL